MSYRNRKAFQTYRMRLIAVKDLRNAGSAGWVSCYRAFFEDGMGIVQQGYGAAWQGAAKRDLGVDDLSAALSQVGKLYDVEFGVNSQFVRAKLVEA